MKPKVVKSPTRTRRPAEVVIAVTRFADVLADNPTGDRTSGYTLQLRRNHPQVRIEGDDIIVRPPAVEIRFLLTSSEGKDRFVPFGVAFVRDSEDDVNDRQRLGLQNFPREATRLDERAITILDAYKDRRGRVRYKFSVTLQRGADGKIGIIDPGIVHEND